MKAELKTFASIQMVALFLWVVIGGLYGAYQAMAEMGYVMISIALWPLIIMMLILVGAAEYHSFWSMIRILKALHRWIEMRKFLN